MDPNKTSFPGLKSSSAIPNNFVVDQQGIVRYSRAGFRVNELEKTAAELLAESPPANPPQPTTRAGP